MMKFKAAANTIIIIFTQIVTHEKTELNKNYFLVFL